MAASAAVDRLTAEPLLALFASCVVRIDADRGSGSGFRGTGFLVAPGEVLTCAHVVHACRSITATLVDGTCCAAEVNSPLLADDDPAAKKFYPLPDIALLRLTGAPAAHPCVQLDDSEPVSQDALRLGAYTCGEHAADAVGHSGVILKYELTAVEGGWRLFKLRGGQVVGGFSGGPLLNDRTKGVCAVLETSRGGRTDLGGFAVPMAAVLEVLPDLAQRNVAFHATDKRWRWAVEQERVQAAEREGRRTKLPMMPAHPELAWQSDEASPSELLRPRYGVVPFTGRDELLAEVVRWREADEGLRVLVLTGGGGVGKTRTAVEVCAAAERAGWTAGLFASSDDVEQGLDVLAGWPGRLLVAIDYAETRPRMVAKVLWRLHRHPDRPPTRVILIVRQAAAATHKALRGLFASQTDTSEELGWLIRRAMIVHLGGGKWELDRRTLFDTAVAAFAERLRRTTPTTRVDLQAGYFDRPLFVLIAALLAVRDPGLDLTVLSDDELLEEILEHEASYWERWNTRRQLGLDQDDQKLAVALAALFGAETAEDANQLVRLLPGLAAASGERTLAVRRWLARLYGPTDASGDHITPLEPDLLAETLIASTLNDERLGGALDAVSRTQRGRFLVVLGRSATGRDLRQLGRCALARVNQDTLQDLSDHLPPSSLVLAQLAVTIYSALVEKLDQQDTQPKLASALNHLANRLSEVGQWPQAHAAAQKAVTIRRRLVEMDRDEYLPALASALNNLANYAGKVGQPEQAHTTAWEAIGYYHELTEKDPDTHRPQLAAALSNLAFHLREVGQLPQALDPATKAVQHYRELTKKDQDTHRPQLAAALNNLATHLAEARQLPQALRRAEEAVQIRHRLAERNRDAYLPALANSLRTLATLRAAAGQLQQALHPATEAVQYYRELTNQEPNIFANELKTAEQLLAALSTPHITSGLAVADPG